MTTSPDIDDINAQILRTGKPMYYEGHLLSVEWAKNRFAKVTEQWHSLIFANYGEDIADIATNLDSFDPLVCESVEDAIRWAIENSDRVI